MKKLVLPLITLIIGFAAGYYFNASKSTAPATATAALAINDYHAENAISLEEAKLLVDTFGTKGLDDADNRPGGKGPKTRSIFLPLKKLDSLIAALDAARAKDGKTDGLRIYFGRYPKFMPDGKTRYQHPFRNTIILVSTRDTAVIIKGTTQPVNIHLDYFGDPTNPKKIQTFAIAPQNRGEMCPDNCNGAILVCPDPTDPNCGN